jgi:hypothetical protein
MCEPSLPRPAHCCSRSRGGLFLLLRRTMRLRLTANVNEITLDLCRRALISTKAVLSVLAVKLHSDQATFFRRKCLHKRWAATSSI